MVMGEVKTGLRLPDDLYEAIKRLAEKELRSINAQIVTLLKEAIEAREKARKD
jgi:hypothetical protein